MLIINRYFFSFQLCMEFISNCSGRISSTKLNMSDEGRYSSLFLILERIPSFTIKYFDRQISPLDNFIKLKKFPTVLIMRVFIMNEYSNFSSDFAALIDIIISFFNLLILWITLLDFQILNQPCITGKIPLVRYV